MAEAIILVSFGSADDSIRENIFDKLAAEIKEKFPAYEVRQAFTSNFMIKKLARRGIFIQTPAEEISKLRAEGFQKIILLPTHLTPGEEFDNKMKICAAPDIEIIPPLMSEPFDKKILATILDCFKSDADEDLVLIGHGSPHKHNPVYENLQRLTGDKVHIGVIEESDTPNFDDVLKRLKNSRAEKILLAPLLFNGGVHVTEDISKIWFNRLCALGYKVRVVRDGLGSFENFRALYIDKLSKRLQNFGGVKDLFPLVSVIIPTFNRPQYFKEALDSALNQTYRNIEVIISDNSTDDATEQLVKTYTDTRIKYFRHKNFDAHDNWNFARDYNNPAAKYVNWLMDDDIFYPTKLEKMIEVYRNNPDVSLVTSAKNYIDANGKVTGNNKNPQGNLKIPGEHAGKLLFIQDNYIGEPTTVLIRKKYLRGNDLCWHADERGFFSLVDVSTWCQLLSKGNLVCLNECLSGFRQHAKQATYWSNTYALTPVAWVKLLKSAWEQKIFIKDERTLRVVIMRLISFATNRLKIFYAKNFTSKEVETLEKTFFALVEALSNGYKIELPPVEYSTQDTIKKIH